MPPSGGVGTRSYRVRPFASANRARHLRRRGPDKIRPLPLTVARPPCNHSAHKQNCGPYVAPPRRGGDAKENGDSNLFAPLAHRRPRQWVTVPVFRLARELLVGGQAQAPRTESGRYRFPTPPASRAPTGRGPYARALLRRPRQAPRPYGEYLSSGRKGDLMKTTRTASSLSLRMLCVSAGSRRKASPGRTRCSTPLTTMRGEPSGK